MVVTCQWCLSLKCLFLDISMKKHLTMLQCLYMSSGVCGRITAEMSRRSFLILLMPYWWQLVCLVFCVIFRILSEMCYAKVTTACHTHFNLAVLKTCMVCRSTI